MRQSHHSQHHQQHHPSQQYHLHHPLQHSPAQNNPPRMHSPSPSLSHPPPQQPQPYQSQMRTSGFHPPQPPGKIWNPCSCCKGCCNLRCNCIFAAVVLFMAWVSISAVGFEKIPAEVNCTSYVGDGDKCAQFNSRRIGLKAGVAIVGTFWLAAGVFILIAAIFRIGTSAQIAGGLIFLGMMVYLILLGIVGMSYMDYEEIDLFSRHIVFDTDGREFEEDEVIGYSVAAGAGLILSVFLQLWAVLCCFQLKKQIDAGVDLDPVVKTKVSPSPEIAGTTSDPAPPPPFSNQDQPPS